MISTDYSFHVKVIGSSASRRRWCENRLNDYTRWLSVGMSDRKSKNHDQICYVYSFDDENVATEFLLAWDGQWCKPYDI